MRDGSKVLESFDPQDILSWLIYRSNLLSEIGIALQQPSKHRPMLNDEAKQHLKATKVEVKERAANVALLLKQTGRSSRNLNKVGREEHCSPTSRDIEIHWNAHSYLGNNREDIASAKEQVSGDIRETDGIRFRTLIKRYWHLLRIQIRILTIQFSFGEDSEFCLSSKPFPERADFQQLSDRVQPSTPSSSKEKSSFLSTSVCLPLLECSPLAEMNKAGESQEEGTRKELFAGDESVQVTPRDDGYGSKLGESMTEEAFSIDGYQSTEVESVAQADDASKVDEGISSEFHEVVEHPREDEEIALKPKSFSKALASAEWEAIYSVVERFSHNAVTLLSWLDELEEIDRQGDEVSPQFYVSQAERRETAILHVNRLYDEVIDDSSNLLRNLPSERTTLLTVLENIDNNCRRRGVVVGDDLDQLLLIEPSGKDLDPKSGFLSAKLRSQLSSSLPTFSASNNDLSSLPLHCNKDHFHPLATSSPRLRTHDCSREIGSGCSADPKRDQRHFMIADEGIRAVRDRRDDYASSWNWSKFLNEHDELCERLGTVEMLLDRAESTALSSFDVEMARAKYFRQLRTNEAKKEKLQAKADLIETLHPEKTRQIRNRMCALDDMWNCLLDRCSYSLSPVGSRYVLLTEEEQRFYEIDHLRNRFVYYDLYDEFLPLSPTYHRLLTYVTDDWQLSDFTFRQMRDRLHLSPTCRRKDLDWTCERPYSARLPARDSWVTPAHRYTQSSLARFPPTSACDSRPTSSGSTKRSPFMTAPGTFSKRPEQSSETSERSVKAPRDVKSEVDGLEEAPSTSFVRYSVTIDPSELSSYIKAFHDWLKSIEKDVFELSSGSIGWDPSRIRVLLWNNQDRKFQLEEKKERLNRIVRATDHVLSGSHKQVSEFCLTWSSWMLEQRYYNLVLFTIDMECVLERRTDALTKDSQMSGVSQALGDIWNDRGEDLRPTVQTTDRDYDIFWLY